MDNITREILEILKTLPRETLAEVAVMIQEVLAGKREGFPADREEDG